MIRPIPLLDLAFLWIDRPETPANIGSLLLFAPPARRSAARAVDELLNVYRNAVPVRPFDCVPEVSWLAPPHWRQVGIVDARQHVFRHRLATPGTASQLHELVARLHEPQLPRDRPLFAVHFIDGLQSGGFAVYVKSHHATWDGRSALVRTFAALGTEPGPIAPPFYAQDLQSAGAPGAAASAASGMRALVQQGRAFRELLGKLQRRTAADGGSASGGRGNAPFAGPQTRFNDPVTAPRRFAAFSLPLEAMRQAGHAFGGTVNDVVVAVVDAGVNRYLALHDERPREPLVAMCPISQREEHDVEPTTKVATLFVRLGAPGAGIGRRMQSVVESTRSAKREFGELSREAGLDYAALAFGLWFVSHTLGLDAITRPVINLVISNVGGVPGERYLGRNHLVGAYPVSMLADPAGLNVTTLSSGGRMDFGIIANRRAVPEPAEIATHCVDAFAQLRRVARGRVRT